MIIQAVGDPFYKISSEALLVLESLVKVLRPLDQPTNFNFKPYTNNVIFFEFVHNTDFVDTNDIFDLIDKHVLKYIIKIATFYD